VNAPGVLAEMRSLIPAGRARPAMVLIVGTLMVVISRHTGAVPFRGADFAGTGSIGSLLSLFLPTFLLFGVLPAAGVGVLFGGQWRSFGLCVGDWKAGLRLLAVSYPVIALALLLPAALTPEIRDFYPIDRTALVSWGAFARLEITRIVVFYTAWEFIFRGFMLFGVEKSAGPWIAIAAQTIPSCLWHIGMPTSELVSSIAGGILFGMMAVRTRSILWPFILHCLIGTTLDSFIVLTT